MSSSEHNTETQKFRELKPFPGISSSPSFVIIKKTLKFDLLTRNRLIISLVFMVLVPALIIAFTPPDVLSGDEYLVQLLGFTTWYYNFSILFPIIIIGATGPLISEELRSGTMLFLVSKPIDRIKIVLSKFIALYIFGLVISIISLSLISLIALIKYFINPPLY